MTQNNELEATVFWCLAIGLLMAGVSWWVILVFWLFQAWRDSLE